MLQYYINLYPTYFIYRTSIVMYFMQEIEDYKNGKKVGGCGIDIADNDSSSNNNYNSKSGGGGGGGDIEEGVEGRRKKKKKGKTYCLKYTRLKYKFFMRAYEEL